MTQVTTPPPERPVPPSEFRHDGGRLGYRGRPVPRRFLHGALLAAAVAPGCARDPADAICPAAAPGDLVVTELRGEQSGGDTWGQWIELYNAGADLDLEGAVIDLRAIDGSRTFRVLVRRSVPVAAGDYVVLGDFPDATRPAHVDYGFQGDFTGTFPSTGGVTVTACGDPADAYQFPALPATGTWSLGLSPPTADGNDDAGAWCADTAPSDDTTQLGLPGTPGAANRPCT